MNWNDYHEEMDRASFDPAFRRRVIHALLAAQQGGKEEKTMKKTMKKGLRRTLIAAAVLAFAAVSAIAITASLRDSARQDMGIQTEQTIAEWTEYEDGTVSAQSKTGSKVECISTMCSGDTCEVYLLVNGVDAQTAADIENEQIWCEWDFGYVDTGHQNATIGVQQVAYDADTQQSLVRVSASSVYFETAKELKMELVLRRDGEIARAYGELTIPITQSQALQCAVELPIESAGLSGMLTGVRVYAGYVEVVGSCASLADAGIDETDFGAVDAFVGGWHTAISEALSGAELVYVDGTRTGIAELPSPFAGEWIFSNGELVPVEQGQLQMRHVCTQALDLTQITAIVIGGIEYPLG